MAGNDGLAGRTIVITGASAGIGAATARACAAAGMHLVLVARRRGRLEELAGRLEARGAEQGRPIRTAIVEGDVTDGDVTGAALAAAESVGGLDAVFANAGYGLLRPMCSIDEAALREIFEVNFFASVQLVRAAAGRLIEAGRPGHLLMCSSCVARFCLARYGAYAATKAAQAMVCTAMGAELRPHGIAVSSVHPIGTTTEFAAVARRRAGEPAEGPATTSRRPGFLVQDPDTVARAIVRCLRRPRPEVWTSRSVRMAAALAVAVPSFHAFAARTFGRRGDPP